MRTECDYKHICYPNNMTRWLDFQLIFPRLMELRNRNGRMSLHEATEWYGVNFNLKGAHRALYDAKVMTKLVALVLTGEYIAQRDYLKRTVRRDATNKKSTGFSLAELCGNFFSQFVSNDNSESEFTR